MKATQYFSDEYLERCAEMTPQQIAKFLDEFRQLHGASHEVASSGKSKLISLKVPQPLLDSFRTKSDLLGVPYQTQIKRLMIDWLKGG